MSIDFPELPSYAFSWRSIQVEPIPHSNEKITLGVIVEGSDGRPIVTKLVTRSKLKAVFGNEFGNRIDDATRISVDSADIFYSKNSLSEYWMPPLDGFTISSPKKSLANNSEEALLHASGNCSLLWNSIYTNKKDNMKKPGLITLNLWRDQIFETVTNKNNRYKNYFNKEIAINATGKPQRFGFISEKYAAQFDAISRDNAARENGFVRAQSKLWQLDQLRESDSLIFKPENYELILHKPESTEKNKNLISDFIEELTYEAKKRSIGLHAASSVDAAASYILKNAA